MKSWKTTFTGIVVVAGIIVAHYWPDHTELVANLTTALVGLGLIAARDNNVSSESAGAK